MRVAYFIGEYLSMAGSQKSLLYTIRAWKELGGEAVVILPGEGICAQMYRQAGVPTYILTAPPSLHLFQRRLLRLPLWRKAFIWLKEILPYSWKVAHFMRRKGCQLLHCNSTRSILMVGWVPYWQKVPIILHIRGKQVEKGYLWWLAQQLAMCIIIVAHHLRNEIAPSHWKKLRLIHNTVDIEEIERLARDRLPSGVDQTPNLVVALSSVIPTKGIHHLVHSASIVANHFPVTFSVAGREPDHAYSTFVRQLVSELCPGVFSFLGWLSNPYPLLRSAQIFVLPTIAKPEKVPTDNPQNFPVGEGLPLAVLEAMALSKPVVATSVDGCEEAVVNGETGYLVPPADPPAMAGTILKLLKNPDIGAKMGKKGRERVEALFNLQRHKGRVAEIYHEVMSKCQKCCW